jgi:hypothetical protein
VLLLCAAAIAAAVPSHAARAESAEERRQEISRMSADEQGELARQQARFAALDPAEQARLRKLDSDLAADPRQAELRRVMRAYHDWLKTLSPAEREELKRLAPAERVARIQELRQKQDEKAARQLREEDLEVFAQWIEGHVRAKASRDDLRRWEKLRPEFRRGAILAELWRKMWLDRPRKRSVVTDAQIAELRGQLSPTAQQQLDNCPTDADRHRLVGAWIFQLQTAQWARGGKMMGAYSQEELQQFFETKLAPEEQRDLLLLPTEERDRRLWFRYHQAQELDRAWRELETMLPEGE